MIERQFYARDRRGSATNNLMLPQDRRRADKSPMYMDNFFVPNHGL